MLAGRTNVTRDNVSFNYQLNDKRVKLAVVVREAKSDENISKYYDTQKSVIQIRKACQAIRMNIFNHSFSDLLNIFIEYFKLKFFHYWFSGILVFDFKSF